jgi:hypothetical protein
MYLILIANKTNKETICGESHISHIGGLSGRKHVVNGKIMSFRPVARQRQRHKELYNSRCYIIFMEGMAVARQWL